MVSVSHQGWGRARAARGMRRRQQPAAGRLPLGKPAERGHGEARLEVAARAHAAVERLEQVHHAGGDQQAEHHRQRRRSGRPSGCAGLQRLDRRREQRDVGLAARGFRAVLHAARRAPRRRRAARSRRRASSPPCSTRTSFVCMMRSCCASTAAFELAARASAPAARALPRPATTFFVSPASFSRSACTSAASAL